MKSLAQDVLAPAMTIGNNYGSCSFICLNRCNQKLPFLLVVAQVLGVIICITLSNVPKKIVSLRNLSVSLKFFGMLRRVG